MSVIWRLVVPGREDEDVLGERASSSGIDEVDEELDMMLKAPKTVS